VLNSTARGVGLLIAVIALVLHGLVQPAAAAGGDLVADVALPEPWPQRIAPSVAFDGHHLYYTDHAGSTLRRIDVPAAGGTQAATGQVNVPISGAPSGIMSIAYDRGRDAFWAVGGDGQGIYLLRRTGAATLVFTVDPANDRPFMHLGHFAHEVKIAYDGTDDTLWYAPDATSRIYHYHTFPDALGTAALVAATPFINVAAAPNDMNAECGYSQHNGVAVGGANLFVSVTGCAYYFEYTRTGTKVAAYRYNPYPYGAPGDGSPTQDMECDDVSYSVPVFWIRDGWDGHIRAFEQPAAGSCGLGGGAAAASATPATVESLTTTTFSMDATSHAVAMPAAVNASDLLVCLFANDNDSTVIAPAGWTQIATAASGTAVRFTAFLKTADGSEDGTTVDFATSAPEQGAAHVYRISGHFGGAIGGSEQPGYSVATATGTSTRPDPPPLDPSGWDVEPTLWLAAFAIDNVSGGMSGPAYYGEATVSEPLGLQRASIGSARRTSAVAAEDPGAFTNNANQAWVAATLAIRPGN
jgi:hypothetical protein